MINHEFLKCKGKGHENEMQLFLILAVACIFFHRPKMGNYFSNQSLFYNIFGNIRTSDGLFFKRPSIRDL